MNKIPSMTNRKITKNIKMFTSHRKSYSDVSDLRPTGRRPEFAAHPAVDVSAR
jgi:hypothetical protein